jgi:hypothetical protein
MDYYKVTPDGKTVLVVDLTVSPVAKKARKMPVAAPAAHVPQGRIFAPVEPVPAAHSPEPEPHDDWQYSLPDPLPEADNGAFEEYARPAAPVPQAFLAADLSGSESEDEEEEDIGVDLATKYPKRTYLDVPYTSKDSAKELGAKWDSENRKWYVYKINPHHDRHGQARKQSIIVPL